MDVLIVLLCFSFFSTVSLIAIGFLVIALLQILSNNKRD